MDIAIFFEYAILNIYEETNVFKTNDPNYKEVNSFQKYPFINHCDAEYPGFLPMNRSLQLLVGQHLGGCIRGASISLKKCAMCTLRLNQLLGGCIINISS